MKKCTLSRAKNHCRICLILWRYAMKKHVFLLFMLLIKLNSEVVLLFPLIPDTLYPLSPLSSPLDPASGHLHNFFNILGHIPSTLYLSYESPK